MPVELIPWLVAAASAAAGGIAALVGGRRGRVAWLAAAVLGAAGTATGLAWRAWIAGAWPGRRAEDALALLAAGALVVLLSVRAPVTRTSARPGKGRDWREGFGRSAAQRGEPAEDSTPEQPAVVADPAARQQPPVGREIASGLALLGITALLIAAVLLAWRTASAPFTWAARAPLFGLRNLLAAIGLGGWLVSAAASLPWVVRVARGRTVRTRPADDPGRPAALIAFPWLTAALLAGAAWQLMARAAPWQATSAGLWEGVAWLLGAGYLHLTSNRRPVRLPAWLATLLAGAAVAAAVAAALWADSWL